MVVKIYSFQVYNPFLQVQILSLTVAQKCVLHNGIMKLTWKLSMDSVPGQKNSSFKCIANIAAHDLHLNFVF